jgi:hypothetical protein
LFSAGTRHVKAQATGDAVMPSPAMQDSIDVLRDRRKAGASQAPPTLEERRAAFTPGDRVHPVPEDVVVTEVTADVTLEIGEGLPHVYQLLLGTPEAAEATGRIGTFLRARVR